MTGLGLAAVSSLSLSVLCGCGVQPGSVGVSSPARAVGQTGALHGGQQPIAGASVMLMVPSSAQYGGAASVLASTTTSATGTFTLPGYTCPPNSGLVYLLATGGDSGSGSNAVITQAAVLGPCNLLTPSTFINITEVTTVAAAYVLAPFAAVNATGTGIGAPATNLQGLTNAYGAANNLVDLTSGYARTPTAVTGLVLPQAELNTLADVLASCVNSTGSTVATSPCGILFGAATPAGGVAPVDTFQAALNVALNPGLNPTALYNLVTAAAPFQPTLSAAPTDFALAIQYNGPPIAGSYGTQGIAIDAMGNAWIATGNTLGTPATTHTLTEISPAGVYLSGTAGFGASSMAAPFGLAIDSSGDVYVTDLYAPSIFEFAPNGSLTKTLAAPFPSSFSGIAIDTDDSLWLANSSKSYVSHLTTAGINAAGSPYGGASNGFDIVLNKTGNWTAGPGSDTSGYLMNYTNSRGQLLSYQAGAGVGGVAFDSAGNVWHSLDITTGGSIRRWSGSGVSNLTPVGVALPRQPLGMFVDGLNHVWVNTYIPSAQNAPGALLEYSNAGAPLSPATGFTANGTLPPSPGFPGGMVVDGSGNLWLTGAVLDSARAAQANAFVTELVGMAAPVVTPITVAARTGVLGTRP